ncbi:SUMF1/EgtB/PvdO family nonheme iron enzyme [Cupriavidus pinatubonensis]|uniref:SUMF1/EgtB/PvdO family nonheme iron enzyme n=1 Tax=Cupriavidus pinatubonensis TaxID=248026 RepID=UPI00112DA21A|nr:SUMF1/EgtB/PvdO family nonheme iron enzyme [Cupriavidus pinatubonensis]QYY32490.1 SUMF1/EgtB/PvdO family nonheme iron enzyme [Cupriavidus pinatubonensis]TPQ34546.1 glycosyl transferase [Cupriavidus pinatubonensis]
MSGFSMLPDLYFSGGQAGWSDARRLPREGLAQALVDARSRTLAWLAVFGQTRKAWDVPRQYDADPPLWTLGHIAWHAEWWCLRGVRQIDRGGVPVPVASDPSRLDGADEWFDPDRIGPDERWEIVLPDVAVVKQYASDVLDGLLRRLALLSDDSDVTLYPFRRALFLEDAQAENLAALLQALGLAPAAPVAPGPGVSVAHAGTLHFPGGRFTQGWSDPDGYAQPDELPPQPTYVPAFEMDAALVSNAQFLEFVQDGGYEHPAWWSTAGRQWLMTQERSAPRYWSRHPESRAWMTERFGTLRTLNPDEAVRHVTLYEAQAWCAWAGRRLPVEAEWELAALQNRGLQWGSLREWTASPYEPYAGFAASPSDSELVARFGTHQAVRGTTFVSSSRQRHVRARLALLPEEDVVLVGFRSCSM